MLDISTADDVSGDGKAAFFLAVMAAVAKLERDMIAERIRDAKRAQRAKGEYSGGVRPFGWQYDADRKLVPVETEQKLIAKGRARSAF